MATPTKPVRLTYITQDEGFYFGSYLKKEKPLALFPIQAAHYVENGRLKLATDATKDGVPLKPLKATAGTPAPGPVRQRASSSNDPG